MLELLLKCGVKMEKKNNNDELYFYNDIFY